jgi:hypothetical protein
VPETEAEIRSLVERELASITDRVVIEGLRAHLVPPSLHFRNWDYGKPGERYPCWSIASDPSTDTGIVYSEHGFGPRNPWGLVFLSEPFLGEDSGWFTDLVSAFLDSLFAAHLPIWNVVERAPGSPPHIVISDLNCDRAFQERNRLAEKAGGSKFHVVYRGQSK